MHLDISFGCTFAQTKSSIVPTDLAVLENRDVILFQNQEHEKYTFEVIHFVFVDFVDFAIFCSVFLISFIEISL